MAEGHDDGQSAVLGAPGFLIGQLTAQVTGLNQRLDQLIPVLTKLDQTCDETVRRLDLLEVEIRYMKPHVSSWSRCKNRLAGAIFALPLAGGGIGLALDRVGGLLLKLIGDQ
ncbi:MAG: hypothetical protein SGJ07_15175 [Rhodospirillaceae bacterium]|nr:hypothetical protein [Rhodospirillaceae bacterium]